MTLVMMVIYSRAGEGARCVSLGKYVDLVFEVSVRSSLLVCSILTTDQLNFLRDHNPVDDVPKRNEEPFGWIKMVAG